MPVSYTDDPFEALELQADLQSKYTGGTVLHLYMGQRISSAKVCRDLVKRVLTNYRLPYITITPTFSVCPKHGYISGEHKFCPLCDEEKMAEKISHCNFLTLKVLHFHFGGTICNIDNYISGFANIMELYCKFKRKYKSLEYFDFGGGMPVKYSLTYQFDYKALISKIISAVAARLSL